MEKNNWGKCCYALLFFSIFLFASNIFAANRIVNLVVAYKAVNFGGKSRLAIAVNNQIPAPTLHFKNGDHVTINVYNHLDKGTAIHWHGILVPWQMDGVEGVTQKPIPPGGVFHYRFTLYQSGTYWYHAHKDLQEQEGLYGAFIIDPQHPPAYRYTKNYVVVLSDWTNAPAEKVLANLKKDGDYYSPKFPLQPSLIKFIHDYRKASPEERKKLIEDYKIMQQMRMSIYDFSDVAYDAYLLNGQTKINPWTARVKVGDVVRLRYIGAAGSTIYRVTIPGAVVKMVHIEGNDVKPYVVKDFIVAPGETYDVLVNIQKNRPYIIYAESIDTRGKAYGALITDPRQPIDYQKVEPFPEPEPVTREMMDNMMMPSMKHDSMNKAPYDTKTAPSTMSHAAMQMDKTHSSHDMAAMPMPSTEKKPAKHSGHSKIMPGVSHGKKNKSQQGTHVAQTSMSHAGMQMGKKNSPHDMHIMVMPQESPEKMPANHPDHSAMSKNMKMDSNMPMGHSMHMNMPTEASIIGDTISPPHSYQATTSGTKYQDLIAAVKTNNPSKPIAGIIRMELFGYMGRYIWFINGLPEYKTKPISIAPGKRYRIIFTNNSMMRHPMHIHGHWFILRNGHGAYDPLLHTIEVPPGATAVADFDSDASGQWFFHCHHLYHMMTGMSRVFQYKTILEVIHGKIKPEKEISVGSYYNQPIIREDAVIPIDTSLIHHPMAHASGFYFSNFLDVGEDPFNNAQRMTFEGMYGGDYNKLQLYMNDAEMSRGRIENADMDIFYWHAISQFWAIKGGANYFYRPARNPYWQPGIGIEGLMPFFIDTDLRSYYHNGSVKFDAELSRDTQITNNFFVRLGIRSIFATQTVRADEIGSGLNQMRYIVRPYYRLMPGLNIFTEYEYEQDYGALKNIRRNARESTRESTLTFGLSILF